ncbi:RidA family protein [Crenobacter luteus]|uniref:Reactive intermediate/imine deaminase n=1 Tax=Crenobacter luteus TaxID=1452487 RepID=A0A163CPF1_9NEIS|nr:RidA family protein [Crenobacter luteus]KZE32896.1 reactive intermediate/imine deaminase [Crenobacter luteus]
MAREIIHTDLAPAAIGAYSQAVKAGDTVYLSGQIPLDPATMTVVEGGFAAEAHQVFKNLKAVCEAAGGDLNKIVKLNAFLTDLSNFATFNEVMGQYFAQPFPARAAIGVASLPKGVQVEADAVMVLGE